MSRYKLIKDNRGYRLEDRIDAVRPIRVDFADSEFRHRLTRAGHHGESVAKAVKPQPGMTVLDCTGGLGKDAFLLAHLGARVVMYERSPVVHCLLKDGLERAGQVPDLAEAANRIELRFGDARAALNGEAGAERFQVVYLDPMFPARHKSALVKREMRYLQQLLGEDASAETLLAAALGADCDKVVLKRPAASDWQPPTSPNHVITSKTSRYEVYVPSPATSSALPRSTD